MTKPSSFHQEESLREKVTETKSDFHQARTEYELAMRREILHRVNHCPCCFEGFFESVKAQIQEEAIQKNFEPDVIEVLTRMSLTLLATAEENEIQTGGGNWGADQ